MSADGRFVVFISLASNLAEGDTNEAWDVFVRDRWLGTTERVSIGAAGEEANGDSCSSFEAPAISATGRFVAFSSEASNLVQGDANEVADVFVCDRGEPAWPAPVADFVASPLQGTLPLEVSFTDRSQYSPSAWSWAFGDGQTTDQQNPVHTYGQPGLYSVSLSVTSPYGSDTKLRSGYIAVWRFDDLRLGHWAFDEVEACFGAGIVTGYPDSLYHPDWPVTRDGMAVYLTRALAGGDANVPPGPPIASFLDVPTDHWAYRYVEYAKDQRVVEGTPRGLYLPALQVDRGQIAVYLARVMVAPGGDAAVPDPTPPATFPDVPTTFWSYKQVEYCVSQSVVAGYTDGKYHPEYPVTRDQMAVYVARAFGLM